MKCPKCGKEYSDKVYKLHFKDCPDKEEKKPVVKKTTKR